MVSMTLSFNSRLLLVHSKCFHDPVCRTGPIDFTFSLSKRKFRHSMPAGRLPRTSSTPSLTCLTRGARYAQAEAALRVALSRCDAEPSPLELQVRVLEKGLQAWSARAGRGYERVQKAEEALSATRQNEEEGNEVRGSFSELQREKWMGMKERDEALAMVEKIKELIKELNADIRDGVKVSANNLDVDSVPSKAALDDYEETLPSDTASKKAAILFSGRFPQPYLEKLPRSRRSVEPLRLPLQIVNQPGRKRSSTLRSEPAGIAPSTPSTTQPPTPHPATPTNEFGAAFIHAPFPLKSAAEYLAEIERSGFEETGHMTLPSYVGALLDELTEDRLRHGNLHIDEVFQSYTHTSTSSHESTKPNEGMTPPESPIPNHKLRSKGLLGRPFSSPPSVYSRSPSKSRSKENHDPSILTSSANSLTSGKVVQQSLSATTADLPRSSPEPSSRIQQIKSPGRIGILMHNVKKGVMRVSRIAD